MSELLTVEVMPSEAHEDQEFDYDRLISDPVAREWAESAAGFITFGLGQAVVKVLEAGNLLIEAKARLPHGEYLPWVQKACRLKPQYASKLIKAADWANVAHAQHLEGVTDTTTLFLLSADTTPEDVREWFIERCAAGDVPTRKEVLDRKRGRSESARQRGLIEETISALKLRPEALDLAAQAQHISTRQLLQELDLDELPKGRRHQTTTATYCKNGTGWWKLPIQQPVDVEPSQPTTITADEPKTLRLAEAAALLGKKLPTLRVCLSPSKMKRSGYPTGNGWQAEPIPERGMCLVRRLSS